jgi:hypothetical protein
MRALGSVHNVVHAENSFTVIPSQIITGAVAPIPITIHAFIAASPQWPNPDVNHPVANDVVRLFGDVLSVESDEVLLVVRELEIVPM